MCKLCTILQFWTLQEVVREGEPVEVIFISFDQCPEDMMAYMRECHGDWLAVQHGTVLARFLEAIRCLVFLYFRLSKTVDSKIRRHNKNSQCLV